MPWVEISRKVLVHYLVLTGHTTWNYVCLDRRPCGTDEELLEGEAKYGAD